MIFLRLALIRPEDLVFRVAAGNEVGDQIGKLVLVHRRDGSGRHHGNLRGLDGGDVGHRGLREDAEIVGICCDGDFLVVAICNQLVCSCICFRLFQGF